MVKKTLSLTCEHCGHSFEAPRSLKGGIASCPSCKLAVDVEGGPEPLFQWLVVGGAALVILVAGVTAASAGPGAGVGVLLVGAAIMAVLIISG